MRWKPRPTAPLKSSAAAQDTACNQSRTRSLKNSKSRPNRHVDTAAMNDAPYAVRKSPKTMKATQDTASHDDQCRRLELRRSALRDADLASVLDRSRSEPAMAIHNMNSRRTSQSQRGRQRARSISLCSQRSGLAPVHPPPPLPLSSVVNSASVTELPREASANSLSSDATSNSSILFTELASPQMQARAEFSQRNPDVSLGAQVRKSDLKLSDVLLARAKSNEKFGRRRIRLPRVNTTSSVHPALRDVGEDYSDRCDMFDARHSRQSVVSDAGIALTGTPTRRSRSSKTSASGSPMERRRTRASQVTIEEQGASRSNSPGTKPSALKGSPRARAKGQTRQNTVRILIEPSRLSMEPKHCSALTPPLLPKPLRNSVCTEAHGRDSYASKEADLQRAVSGSSLRLLKATSSEHARDSQSRLSHRTASSDRHSTGSSTLSIPPFPHPAASAGITSQDSRRSLANAESTQAEGGSEFKPVEIRPLNLKRMSQRSHGGGDASPQVQPEKPRNSPYQSAAQIHQQDEWSSNSAMLSSHNTKSHEVDYSINPLKTRPPLPPPQFVYGDPQVQDIWQSVQNLRRMDSEKLYV